MCNTKHVHRYNVQTYLFFAFVYLYQFMYYGDGNAVLILERLKNVWKSEYLSKPCKKAKMGCYEKSD